ncbi:MAG: YHS domain protein [Proteobacteria bacterium]|nr:YHS domain protein [Pseudomonadota bacterium]
MKTWVIAVVGVLVVVVGTFMAVKKVSPVSWGMWGNYNTSSGLALKGYDAVAYIEDAAAVPGTSEFTYDWGDASWQFSSADNMALFKQNPESYAPQFGGFCSFALSKGFTADISPDAWHVSDGKLYVFADKDVQADWVAGFADGTLGASTANWEKR